MGQLMDFYAGEPARIGMAFAAGDQPTLEKIGSHADFSLHMTSIDLDILTDVAAGLLGEGPTSFEESWERRLGGDGEESSAELMSQEWVMLMATSNADRLAPAWAAALAREYSDPTIAVTDDMRTALHGLITLCAQAAKEGTRVVHTWSV
jgi:hypothetical protein